MKQKTIQTELKVPNFEWSNKKENSLPISPTPPAIKPNCIARKAGFHFSGYLKGGTLIILTIKLIIY